MRHIRHTQHRPSLGLSLKYSNDERRRLVEDQEVFELQNCLNSPEQLSITRYRMLPKDWIRKKSVLDSLYKKK